MREHWEEVQEQAVVESVPSDLEYEEANTSLSPTTRFLHHLEEDLFSFHFDFTKDSDRDFLYLHSLAQNIMYTIQLDNQQPSFSLITQVSALPEIEYNPNNNLLAPAFPSLATLPGQQLLQGETLNQWFETDFHPEPVVLQPIPTDGTQNILENTWQWCLDESATVNMETGTWKWNNTTVRDWQYRCAHYTKKELDMYWEL